MIDFLTGKLFTAIASVCSVIGLAFSIWSVWMIRALRARANERAYFHDIKQTLSNLQTEVSDLKSQRDQKSDKTKAQRLEICAKCKSIALKSRTIYKEGALEANFKKIFDICVEMLEKKSATNSEMENLYLVLVEVTTEFETFQIRGFE